MITRIMRSARATAAVMAVNAIACAVAYGLANDLSLVQTMDWIEQTRTTTGYGNYTPKNDTAAWVAIWTMFSNFWLTIALIGHFASWLLPDAWTHEEAEESEAKINAICRALGIDPDAIEKEIS